MTWLYVLYLIALLWSTDCRTYANRLWWWPWRNQSTYPQNWLVYRRFIFSARYAVLIWWYKWLIIIEVENLSDFLCIFLCKNPDLGKKEKVYISVANKKILIWARRRKSKSWLWIRIICASGGDDMSLHKLLFELASTMKKIQLSMLV